MPEPASSSVPHAARVRRARPWRWIVPTLAATASLPIGHYAAQHWQGRPFLNYGSALGCAALIGTALIWWAITTSRTSDLPAPTAAAPERL